VIDQGGCGHCKDTYVLPTGMLVVFSLMMAIMMKMNSMVEIDVEVRQLVCVVIP
jgi:hypothetical protein